MEYFIIVLSSLIEFICFYIISRKYANRPIKPAGVDIAVTLLFVLLAFFTQSLTVRSSWIIGQAFFASYIMFFNPGSILDKLFLYIFSYITMFIIEGLLAIPVYAMPDSLSSYAITLLGSILTLAVILFLFFRFPVSKLYDLLLRSSAVLKLIIINGYLLCIFLLLSAKVMPVDSSQFSLFLLCSVLIVFAINAVTFYYENKISRDQKEIEAYRANLPLYDALIQEVRTQQHEYANHIQALRSLPLTCPDYGTLCQALDVYSEELINNSTYTPLLQINYPLLAAFLFSKIALAEQQNKKLVLKIPHPSLSSYAPEYVLTELIGILTDNAIEATSSGQTILAELSSENGHLIFEISNPAPFHTADEIAQLFQKGYTTKKSEKERHGLGLFNLRTMVQKYHGEIVVDNCAKSSSSSTSPENHLLFRLTI